jgi:adenylate cyclase class 2
MPVEYEAKVLDVDVDTVTAAILAAGGRHRGEALMRRYVYDIVPGDDTRWIRLRDNGTIATLAVKEIAHDGIDGTTETETQVADFDTCALILRKTGHTPKSYQENKRTSFTLGDVELELDTWPRIPTYLEIEGPSVHTVHEAAALLGYTPDQLTSQNTTKIYTHYGIDLTTITHLAFEGTV